MNAFNTVNLAAACILTSTDFARELGIPESKWIYPLGAAGIRDSNDCECALTAFVDMELTIFHSLGTSKLLLKSFNFQVAGRGTAGVRSEQRAN